MKYELRLHFMHNFFFLRFFIYEKTSKRFTSTPWHQPVVSLSIGTYRHHLSLNTVQNVRRWCEEREKSPKPMHKIIINFIWKKSRSSHKTVNKLLLLLGIVLACIYRIEIVVRWAHPKVCECISCILQRKNEKRQNIVWKLLRAYHACIIMARSLAYHIKEEQENRETFTSILVEFVYASRTETKNEFHSITNVLIVLTATTTFLHDRFSHHQFWDNNE